MSQIADARDCEPLSLWRGAACVLVGLTTLAVHHAFAVVGYGHSLMLVAFGWIAIMIGAPSIVWPALLHPMASKRKPIHDVALWLLAGLGAITACEVAHHLYGYALWR